MDFGKIFMRQGILLDNFLCDRVQGVERFATHPRHFPSQVPPPRERGHWRFDHGFECAEIGEMSKIVLGECTRSILKLQAIYRKLFLEIL